MESRAPKSRPAIFDEKREMQRQPKIGDDDMSQRDSGYERKERDVYETPEGACAAPD
jgi:hypothetical protein